MTKQERLKLAREYFRQVLGFTEDIVDDEIYEEVDPDNEFGDELAEEFNLDTINEVFKLGFKAKYGVEYDEEDEEEDDESTDDGEWVDPPPMTPEESDREFKRKNHFLEASDRCCSNCRHHKTHYEHKDHDELMIQKCKLSGLVSQREIDVDFTTSCDQWDMKDEGIYNKTMNPYVELS